MRKLLAKISNVPKPLKLIVVILFVGVIGAFVSVTLIKVFVGILFVAFIGALVSAILKPKLVLYKAGDQKFVFEILDQNFTPDAIFEVLCSLKFKLINYSPVPGYIDKAEVRIGNLTNRSIVTDVVNIDRRRLFMLYTGTRGLLWKLRVPINTFDQRKPAHFYFTIWDNDGQLVTDDLDFAFNTTFNPKEDR